MRWAITATLLIVQVYGLVGKLIGDHTCLENKSYIVNTTEYYIKNVTVRNYHWCLNVPPRCSFYTVKPVNASRIIEKEVEVEVEVCCPGFQETEEHTCVQNCPKCINGICHIAECECYSGFKGKTCELECGPLEWGANCAFKCTCSRGTCDSKTGNCICPSGYNGSQCDEQCGPGFYGTNCSETCKCPVNVPCNHITGECQANNISTTETVQTTSATTEITTTPSTTTTATTTTTTKLSPTFSYDTTESTTPLSETKTAVVTFKNNGKFKPDIIQIQSTEYPENKHEIDITPPSNVISSTEVKQSTTFMKKNQSFKIDSNVIEKKNNVDEENTLSDEAQKGTISSPPNDRNDVVNNASTATAVFIAIVVIVFAIILANKYRKKKKEMRNDGGKQNQELPTIPVYTSASIFHTPLPDPPTIEEPIFVAMTTPIPFESTPKLLHYPIDDTIAPNLNSIIDPKYLYDQPPPIARKISFTNPLTPNTPEPLYQEIPQGVTSEQCKCALYMNTRF